MAWRLSLISTFWVPSMLSKSRSYLQVMKTYTMENALNSQSSMMPCPTLRLKAFCLISDRRQSTYLPSFWEKLLYQEKSQEALITLFHPRFKSKVSRSSQTLKEKRSLWPWKSDSPWSRGPWLREDTCGHCNCRKLDEKPGWDTKDINMCAIKHCCWFYRRKTTLDTFSSR